MLSLKSLRLCASDNEARPRCRELFLAVQRAGNVSRGCSIHNHTTEETQLFRSDIRSAIRLTDSKMHYVGWWIFLSAFSAALAWFGGADFAEDGLLMSLFTAGVLGAVLTVIVIVRVVVRLLTLLRSKKNIPGVIAKIHEVIERNERDLNAAAGQA